MLESINEIVAQTKQQIIADDCHSLSKLYDDAYAKGVIEQRNFESKYILSLCEERTTVLSRQCSRAACDFGVDSEAYDVAYARWKTACDMGWEIGYFTLQGKTLQNRP